MFLKLVMHRMLFCGFLFSFVLIGATLYGAELASSVPQAPSLYSSEPMDVALPAGPSVKAMVKIIDRYIKQGEEQSVIYWINKAADECPDVLTYRTSDDATLMMVLIKEKLLSAVLHLCGLFVSRFPDRIKNVISAQTKCNNTIFHGLASYGSSYLFCYFIDFLKASTLFSVNKKYKLLTQLNTSFYSVISILDYREIRVPIAERDGIRSMKKSYKMLLEELSAQYYLVDVEPVAAAFPDSMEVDVRPIEVV